MHNLWSDPMMQAARRPPSNTYRQSNMSHSAASLESQLASQLQRQATVASASESSLSLGRSAIPSRASVSGPAIQNYEGYREPAAPYGHPGYSASQGTGISRRSSRAQLPSIDDWPEMPQEINPMFRVVSNLSCLVIACAHTPASQRPATTTLCRRPERPRSSAILRDCHNGQLTAPSSSSAAPPFVLVLYLSGLCTPSLVRL